MLIKVDAVQIPDLSLPPVCVHEDTDNGRDRARFIGKYFHSKTRVESNAEQLIHDAESVLLVQKINTRNTGKQVELEVDVLLEHVHGKEEIFLRNNNARFILHCVAGNDGKNSGNSSKGFRGDIAMSDEASERKLAQKETASQHEGAGISMRPAALRRAGCHGS